MRKEDILKIAQIAIEDDPRISNPTRIAPSVRRRGSILNRHTVLQLNGTVSSAYEIDNVEQSVRHKLPDVEIENNLVPRSPTEAL